MKGFLDRLAVVGAAAIIFGALLAGCAQSPNGEEATAMVQRGTAPSSQGLAASTAPGATPTLTPSATNTLTPTPVPTVTPTPRPLRFYVAPDGSDEDGDGSTAAPWATISHAIRQVQDGATILVQPGTYEGEVALTGQFALGVVVRSERPYQARLRHDRTVVTCFTCQGVTLEGFDVAHSGPDANIYVVQIQDLNGDGTGGQRVTLRNNVLHDSYHDDIIKVNNGAGQIVIEGNMFYNMGGPVLDSHIDANSVTDVIIQDNVFFNDYEGSGRPNDNSTGSFIVIKDSNEDQDANLGSRNIIVRRNIFLNWEGEANNAFVVVGEGSKPYHAAQNVLIENNLLLGNSDNRIRTAFHVREAKDVLIRHNTVVGDMPAKAYVVRLSDGPQPPQNENIVLVNNIWSDPTGTMGAQRPEGQLDFADTEPDATHSYSLLNNLYWNGGQPIPFDAQESVNVTDDVAAVVADPALPAQTNLVVPRWLPENGRFADGSLHIAEVFLRLVRAYGVLSFGSAAIDAADFQFAATEDILGRPRSAGAAPDLGAFEYSRPVASQREAIGKASTSN